MVSTTQVRQRIKLCFDLSHKKILFLEEIGFLKVEAVKKKILVRFKLGFYLVTRNAGFCLGFKVNADS
ncbi:hypothetical protein THIOM_003014 [Candidatus Thiomargarita nelsonii]|uniref:Uncharacterized protein n=1 Tax=Candidatus Thiomargarita nelsonii TaxID=1003181 RepID=A0A176RZJ2_9GAMM|nr:hypothetical protein THIOM_003014 [Candidatus Thiomargarita nelsonii]